jgi:hypothetical protein
MRLRSLNIWMITIGWLVLALPWAALGQAPVQDKPPAGQSAMLAKNSPAYSEARYISRNRRDPFLNPLLLVKKVDPYAEVPRGEPPPGIAGMYIAQVKLLGTSTSEQGQMAVFLGTDERAYFLREGDRLFDGFLKDITTDSVVLIRETHLKSGKTTTKTVTKHLRQP